MLLYCIHLFNLALCQNLIPNAGFENLSSCPSGLPERGIIATKPWYIIGNPDAVTPDLFHLNCPLPAQTASVSQFWSNQFLPFEGKGYAGIASAALVNGVFISEGLGTPLLSSLEGSEAYYFEMRVGSKGIDNIDNPLSKDCQTTPKKSIGIYFSENIINQIRESDSNNLVVNTFATGDLVLADSSYNLASFTSSIWYKYSSCFLAKGGELHLGVIAPIGKFDAITSPCQISKSQRGFFHISYYDIDNFLLLKMPKELAADTSICEGEPERIDIRKLVPLPMFENAKFRWEDGNTDSIRILQRPGLYKIEVVMPCTTIPLYLNVKSKDCGISIYVPNAFSPNNDGINDELKPFVKSILEFNYYQFKVFNRWGNIVFSTDNSEKGWDGKIGNKEVEMTGIYVWSLEYELKNGTGNKKFIKSGEVTLIR